MIPIRGIITPIFQGISIKCIESQTTTDLVLRRVIQRWDDILIISSLLYSYKDDLLPFAVYLQGLHEAMEVEGAKDGDKDKGLQIETLVDFLLFTSTPSECR